MIALALALLTMDDAVATAVARNRDLIAAHLDVEAAEIDRVAAGLYPNPQLSYTVGNVILGSANPQGGRVGAFDQTVHTVALSEVVDIWAKRNTRIRAAQRGIDQQRILVEDVLREVSHAVRAAFAEALREQHSLQLARETRSRYAETIRLSRARFSAGDIAEAELRKIELEGLRHDNTVLDEETALEAARHRLGALMGLHPWELPDSIAEPPEKRDPLAVEPLLERALRERPDLRAVNAARQRARAEIAAARRDALPDLSLSVGYTHSNFVVSGDNPDTLYLGMSLPLPLFDRNQAGIGRAQLRLRRIDNEAERLQLAVEHEVTEAVLRGQRARARLATFEGGMLERAETALKVAEKSYRAGAVSLLELLEAQRTYIETRGQYLRARHDFRQGIIDVTHAVGGMP